MSEKTVWQDDTPELMSRNKEFIFGRCTASQINLTHIHPLKFFLHRKTKNAFFSDVSCKNTTDMSRRPLERLSFNTASMYSTVREQRICVFAVYFGERRG